MGGNASKAKRSIDITKIWNLEAGLSIEQRRARYKCGDRYIKTNDIKHWKDVVEDTIKKVSNHDGQMVYSIKKALEELESEASTDGRKKYNTLKEDLKLIQDVSTSPPNFKANNDINIKVSLIQADITTLEVDAVVNAANTSLLGGGGIDGAIHKAAGMDLYKECTTLNGGKTGETKITRGYNLPAKFVLHTVGPIGEKPELLESCYLTCLECVVENEIKSVAFCGISTGVYGYPLYSATHIALRTVRQWLEEPKQRNKIDLIIFCTFLDKEMLCYERLMPLYFPPEGKSAQDVAASYKEAISMIDLEHSMANSQITTTPDNSETT